MHITLLHEKMKFMRSIEITDRNFTDSYSPTPDFADDSFN